MSQNSFLPQRCITLKTFLCFLLLRVCASYSNIDLTLPPLDHLSTGFMITGDPGSNAFGYSVSSAGDINKDGYDDIIVGAPWKSSSKGAAYVIYGGEKSSISNIDLSTPLDPLTTGFTITGNAASDFFGRSVGAAGDINNDGYDDIVIGAFAKNVYKGAVYVIYGGEKSSMANIDLGITTLDPLTTGFKITGDAVNIYFGSSVSSAGDINKDGYADIIVGAPWKSGNKGAAYVIYGGEKSSMNNLDLSITALDPLTTGFMITGNANNDNLGYSASTAGDINNDGYDDIIVGAYYKYGSKGVAYVIYGGEKSSLGNINLATQTLDPLTTGFTITGNAVSDYFGQSVSTAGDINNDGYDDIIVGASNKNGYKGAAYVIYGREKSSMPNLDLGIITLDPLTTGFIITGNAASDYFGQSVSTAGDINNDGYDDIIVGAYGKSSSRGAAYVIYGGEKSSNIDLGIQTLDPVTTGFMLTGSDVSNNFGFSASIAGDINNDGYSDIIVGAYGKSGSKGAAYIIYGGSCPADCDQCNSASECTQCTKTKYLYQSECLHSCPTTTFVSTGDDTCKDCPSHCSVCTSEGSCQICLQGYFLFNSQCVSSPSSSQQAQQNAYQAISSAAKGIGSIVCVGNAVFPLSSLVSKIVQNTRYMNISVTDDLAEIYQTWDTDLISWQVPNVFSNEEDQFRESPLLFARYELDSSFLTNFWPTLLNIGIGLATSGICFLLKNFLKRGKFQGWIYSLVQKLMTGSWNFTLVQAYTCLDDILFYLVLDAKTNPFNSFFAWTSFICALIFLVFGCLLVLFNFWLVKKYQDVKALGKNNKKDLEEFNERNKYWELFYSDFNDHGIWSQSFLATLIIRSTISSLIITVFYDYPLLQTPFLVILDGAIMLFLYFKSPFKTLRGKLAEWFFEIITLLVHIFMFILSLQDSFEKPSEDLKVGLSTGIIYLNTALVAGGLGFMFIEIYETIKTKIKERQVKRLKNSVNEENQSPPLKAQENDAHKRQHEKRANFNLSSEFPLHNNSSIAILNGEPFEALESNFNADNSFGLGMGISRQSTMPIIQRKLRILKPQRKEFEIEGQAKNVKQSKNIVKISFPL